LQIHDLGAVGRVATAGMITILQYSAYAATAVAVD
jgi:hypothetical protein